MNRKSSSGYGASSTRTARQGAHTAAAQTATRAPSGRSPRPGTHGPRKRGGIFQLVAGVVLLMVGAGFLFYPVATDIAARGQAASALEQMRTATVSDSAQATDGSGTAYRSKENDPAYEQLLAYNEAVRNGTGDQVNDPFAFPAEELDSFDLPDGIMGSITIPAMGIQIPLFLGATSEHMEHGAGIIAGTSLPLGEETSNTVIAAHRGVWYGLTMFRDIEKLTEGDQVIIETPWDKLVYRVTSFEVISPNDVDALGIEQGRDMVTLFTCHPYGHNYQRILVHCDRDPQAEAEAAPSPVAGALESFVPTTWSSDSPLLNVEAVLRCVGVALLLLCAVLLLGRAARSFAHPAAGELPSGGVDAPGGEGAGAVPVEAAGPLPVKARGSLPGEDACAPPGERRGRHFRQ